MERFQNLMKLATRTLLLLKKKAWVGGVSRGNLLELAGRDSLDRDWKASKRIRNVRRRCALFEPQLCFCDFFLGNREVCIVFQMRRRMGGTNGGSATWRRRFLHRNARRRGCTISGK